MNSTIEEEYIYGEFTQNEDLEIENKTCSLNSSECEVSISGMVLNKSGFICYKQLF